MDKSTAFPSSDTGHKLISSPQPKTIINATAVRNDFFNILDEVAKDKKTIYVSKDGDLLVKIAPVGDELDKDWAETKKLLDETSGMWSHLSEEEISGRFNEADEAATKKIRDRNW